MGKIYDECLECGQTRMIDEDLLVCDECIGIYNNGSEE